MKKKRLRGLFSGARGQRIFNILYSIGASVVILGALFKLLHLHRAADPMLILGMGTEALIFFLSAFDEQQMGSGVEAEDDSVESRNLGSETLKTVIVEAAQVETPSVVQSSQNSAVPVAPASIYTEAAQTATDEYVRQLNELNDTITKLQASLTQNLQGLNAMYQIQLRDAGSQLESVNKVHTETEQMTETIKQLNAIYERMLNAMQNK